MFDVFYTVSLALTTLADALADYSEESLGRLKDVRRETVGGIDELQDRCLREISLKQPFGKEFRRLAALLKISTSLERIARYISHAAEYATRVRPPERASRELSAMARLADKALNDALEAFEREDLRLLERAKSIEPLIDEAFERVRSRVISAEPCEPRTIIGLAFLARSLERIGDHAIEIVRRTEYYITGERPWESS